MENVSPFLSATIWILYLQETNRQKALLDLENIRLYSLDMADVITLEVILGDLDDIGLSGENIHRTLAMEIVLNHLKEIVEEVQGRIRLYEYKQSEIYNYDQTGYSQDYHSGLVPQEKIDHYVLECIRKILEDKFCIIIDTDSIQHCLEITQGIDHIEDEFLLSDIDESSSISVETQKEAIQSNLIIMDSVSKLQTLDFIIKKTKENK